MQEKYDIIIQRMHKEENFLRYQLLNMSLDRTQEEELLVASLKRIRQRLQAKDEIQNIEEKKLICNTISSELRKVEELLDILGWA